MDKIRVFKCNYYHLKIQLAVSSTPTALDGGDFLKLMIILVCHLGGYRNICCYF